MRQTTESWLRRLECPAKRVCNADFSNSRFPVLPWISPCVHPDLLRLMDNIGSRRELRRGERIFGADENIDRFVLVTRGVTARALGNPDTQSKRAIAIALPDHFAAGNLNYYSRRPAYGRYFALTNAEVFYCSHDMMSKVLRNMPEHAEQLALQLELTALSDRISFAALTLLDAGDRLKAYEISWALNYGRIEPNGQWIRMPYACTRNIRADIISVSDNWLDTQLKEWRRADVWRTEDEEELIRTDFLEPVFRWLMAAAEPSVHGAGPVTLRDLLARP